MSVNLMELVKGAVGSQIGPLAGILGESESTTNSAIGAAIPALLGGLMKKTSTPTGANEVFKTLDDHDGGILDNIGGLLGGGNHSGLLNTGTSLLGMLFGNNQSSLLGTIGRLAGIGNSKAGTLLGLLAPVVMGVLGKQRRSAGLDASGLANMLSSQKDHLAGQIPSELSDTLGLGDMFGGAQRAGAAATQAVGNAGRATAHAAGDAASAGGGLFKWLLPLLVIGGLALIGYKMFFNNGAPTVQTPEISVPEVNVEMPNLDMNLPKIDLPGFDSAAIGKSFGGLTQAIGNIKDVESAQLVLPKLEEANSMVDGLDLGAIAGGPQKEAVAGMLGGLIQKMKTALDTAYAIPGVREILDPVVRPFLQKFVALGL